MFGAITTKGDRFHIDNSRRNVDMVGINYLNPPPDLLKQKRMPNKSEFITFETAEGTLEEQSAILLRAIQDLSIQFIELSDQYDILEKEHVDVYGRWKGTKTNITIATTRTNATIRNTLRLIKIHHWETNQNKASLTEMRNNMEHARRIKMHYNRHMGKTHTATFRTVSHNKRMETSNIVT